MIVVFKATCILLIAAVGMLFRHLLLDWRSARGTEAYIHNTTPFDKLKYNAIFYLISAALILIVVFFAYLLICKVEITTPF